MSGWPGRRIVVALHSNGPPPPTPVVMLFGIAFLIIGITAIVRPGWFRTYPVWDPDRPPQPMSPVLIVATRAFGVVFCVIGLVVLTLGIAKLA